MPVGNDVSLGADNVENNVSLNVGEEKEIDYSSDNSNVSTNIFEDIPHNSSDFESILENSDIVSSCFFWPRFHEGSYGSEGKKAVLLDNVTNDFGKQYCISTYGTKLWYKTSDGKWCQFDSIMSAQFTAARTYLIEKNLAAMQDHVYRLDENSGFNNGLLLANCLLTGGILFYLAFSTVFKSFRKH